MATLKLSLGRDRNADKVELDGKDITNITRAVWVGCLPGTLPMVTLDVLADVEFEGEVDARVEKVSVHGRGDSKGGKS